jgi:hypothetical protein
MGIFLAALVSFLGVGLILQCNKLAFAVFVNEAHQCVGERRGRDVGWLLDRLHGGPPMLAIALSCAALGILLGSRCNAFALLPGVVLALGITILYGLADGWGLLGAVLASMGNLAVLQLGYCLAGIVSSLYKGVDHGVPWYRHRLP